MSNEQLKVAMAASPDKIIPKFATNANINRLENGSLVITFLASSGKSEDGVIQASLIETIMLDEKHSRQFVEVMQKVLNQKVGPSN